MHVQKGIGAALLLICAATAGAATFEVGGSGAVNRFPLGNYQDGADYEEEYVVPDLGMIQINRITFEKRGVLQDGATSFDDNVQIGLAQAANNLAMSTTFANNIGPGFQTVFSGHVSGDTTLGDLQHIDFDNDYTFDTSTGMPLLLYIKMISCDNSFLELASNVDTGGGERLFLQNGFGSRTVDDTLLQMTVRYSAVPDPQSLAIAMMALGGLVLMRRCGGRRYRRRSV
jgi:hypothetical protein